MGFVAGLLDSLDGPKLVFVLFSFLFFSLAIFVGPNAPLVSNLVGKRD